MLLFEWDNQKALSNEQKHGISFDEASTVFGDPLSLTLHDPQHSANEERFVVIGRSHKNRILIVVHTERGDSIRIISARKATKNERSQYMKVMPNDPDMLDEYDFSKGARGKYTARYSEGTNVVVIDPDVAKYFPDHDSVNEALRSLLPIVKRHEKSRAGSL